MFTSVKIDNLEIKNRFMRSATWEALATDEGYITNELIESMKSLALGGVGLICISATFIEPRAKAFPKQIALFDDSHIEGHKKMVQILHELGSKVAIQLSHGGDKASDTTDLYGTSKGEKHREMSKKEILHTEAMFANSAKLARVAGYDMVFLHAGHKYLISTFLSPFNSKRTDEYGGSIENRSRFINEIVTEIKTAVPDMPVGVKMDMYDKEENGLTLEESTQVVIELYKRGCTCFESTSPRAIQPSRSPYHREGSRVWRSTLRSFWETTDKKGPVPIVACMGGIRTGDDIANLLETGDCDMVSLSRPFISQADFVNVLAKDPHAKSDCVSCSGCFKNILRNQKLICVVKSPI